jgi:hypothetical protein
MEAFRIPVLSAWSRAIILMEFFAMLGYLQLLNTRNSWSRPVSARADVRLAPSQARPNLFSGD